jgi:hypothetical protein
MDRQTPGRAVAPATDGKRRSESDATDGRSWATRAFASAAFRRGRRAHATPTAATPDTAHRSLHAKPVAPAWRHRLRNNTDAGLRKSQVRCSLRWAANRERRVADVQDGHFDAAADLSVLGADAGVDDGGVVVGSG